MSDEERVVALESRICSALTWIDRYESKNGGLTLVLDNIKDSLLGIRCTDATPGATNSDRFAAGVAAASPTEPPADDPKGQR